MDNYRDQLFRIRLEIHRAYKVLKATQDKSSTLYRKTFVVYHDLQEMHECLTGRDFLLMGDPEWEQFLQCCRNDGVLEKVK